ncbi:hypothetical protein Bca101_091590 [Brassica carinata]
MDPIQCKVAFHLEKNKILDYFQVHDMVRQTPADRTEITLSRLLNGGPELEHHQRDAGVALTTPSRRPATRAATTHAPPSRTCTSKARVTREHQEQKPKPHHHNETLTPPPDPQSAKSSNQTTGTLTPPLRHQPEEHKAQTRLHDITRTITLEETPKAEKIRTGQRYHQIQKLSGGGGEQSPSSSNATTRSSRQDPPKSPDLRPLQTLRRTTPLPKKETQMRRLETHEHVTRARRSRRDRRPPENEERSLKP